MRWHALTFALSLVIAAPTAARAQNSPTTPEGRTARVWGHVVRVDQDLLILDRAGEDLRPGQRVRVFRPMEVRNPVTRATLRDRFPLGVVTLHSVGEQLSIARIGDALLRPPQVGDEVELVETPAPQPVAATTPLRATTPQGATSPACPPSSSTVCLDADDRSMLDAWRETLGRAPSQRIARWTAFINSNPSSRHIATARAAIAQLLGDASAQRPAQREQAPGDAPGVVALSMGIPALTLGDPAVLALQIMSDRVRDSARLFVRRPGAEAYETVAMRADGDRFMRVEVPRRFVALEGFEYFVEFDSDTGQPITILGSAAAPSRVAVSPRAEDLVAASGRTRVDLRAEYADVGSRTVQTPGGAVYRAQRFYLVEGDFFQRLSASALYGYRVGFGVYDGWGVALSDVNTSAPTQHSTVIYGYHELEFRVVSMFHVIARASLGVHANGIVGGAQLRLRIGDERRTNLVLGGELFNQVGQRAYFALNVFVHPRWPLMAQGEVFDQSFSGGDPMFRFIAQAGFRVAPWFTLSARGSYQLRNIENGGFGGGLATTFDW